MKVRSHHARDFLVYLKYARTRRGVGFWPKQYPVRPRGDCDTLEAFARFESQGDMKMRPRHPRVLALVLQGKALLNFQIKEWAAGWFDCGGRYWFEQELKPEFPWMPEWVWEAVEHQRWKYA